MARSRRYWQPRAGLSAGAKLAAGAGPAQVPPPPRPRPRPRQAAARAEPPASVSCRLGCRPGAFASLRRETETGMLSRQRSSSPLPRSPRSRSQRFRRFSWGTPNWQAPPPGGGSLIGRLGQGLLDWRAAPTPRHPGLRSRGCKRWEKPLGFAPLQLCGRGKPAPDCSPTGGRGRWCQGRCWHGRVSAHLVWVSCTDAGRGWGVVVPLTYPPPP